MSPPESCESSVRREVLLDVCRVAGALVVGLSAIALLSVWHRLTSSVESGAAGSSPPAEDISDATLLEYELGWYHYLKAFDAHHGPGGSPERDVRSGSFLRGLRVWAGTRFLRGYTLGDEVYVCPNAPRVLRVHQAGHAPSFGSEFPTLVRPRREHGGLEDSPLYTLDVMLPGAFPHTFLRLRDSRNLTEEYDT